jgi:hypothetical protein
MRHALGRGCRVGLRMPRGNSAPSARRNRAAKWFALRATARPAVGVVQRRRAGALAALCNDTRLLGLLHGGGPPVSAHIQPMRPLRAHAARRAPWPPAAAAHAASLHCIPVAKWQWAWGAALPGRGPCIRGRAPIPPRGGGGEATQRAGSGGRPTPAPRPLLAPVAAGDPQTRRAAKTLGRPNYSCWRPAAPRGQTAPAAAPGQSPDASAGQAPLRAARRLGRGRGSAQGGRAPAAGPSRGGAGPSRAARAA